MASQGPSKRKTQDEKPAVQKRPPGKRGRHRKPAEKILSREVKDILPESLQYTQLLEFEKRLDATLMRKRMDIQDCLKKPFKTKRVIRLFLSNTHTNQPMPGDLSDDANPPEWTFRIEGRVIDDPTVKPEQKGKRRFSTFINRLFVEFERTQGAEDNFVEWIRSPSSVISDGFEVTRRGSGTVNITLLLDLECQPVKFRLAPPLAELVGMSAATRVDAVFALWQYIKTNNLIDPHDRDYFKCDVYLARVFSTERIKFHDLPTALTHLLLPPEPLVFYYEMNNDPTVLRKQQVYDIEIETDDNARATLNSFMLSTASQTDLRSLDDQIQDLVRELERTRSKRDFMMGFAQDPEMFIAAWVASQVKELSDMNTTTAQGELQRHTSYYSQPWVEGAVQRYFSGIATDARVATQIQNQELPK